MPQGISVISSTSRRRPPPSQELYRSHVLRDDGMGQQIESLSQATYARAENALDQASVPVIDKHRLQNSSWQMSEAANDNQWATATRESYARPAEVALPKPTNTARPRSGNIVLGNDAPEYTSTTRAGAEAVSLADRQRAQPKSDRHSSSFGLQWDSEVEERQRLPANDRYTSSTMQQQQGVAARGRQELDGQNTDLHVLKSSVFKSEVDGGVMQSTAAAQNDALVSSTSAADYAPKSRKARADAPALLTTVTIAGQYDVEDDAPRGVNVPPTSASDFVGYKDVKYQKAEPSSALYGSSVKFGNDEGPELLSSISQVGYLAPDMSAGAGAAAERKGFRTRLQKHSFQFGEGDTPNDSQWETEAAGRTKEVLSGLEAAGGSVVNRDVDPRLWQSSLYVPNETENDTASRFMTTSSAQNAKTGSLPAQPRGERSSNANQQESHLQFGVSKEEAGVYAPMSATQAEFQKPDRDGAVQQATVSTAELQKSSLPLDEYHGFSTDTSTKSSFAAPPASALREAKPRLGGVPAHAEATLQIGHGDKNRFDSVASKAFKHPDVRAPPPPKTLPYYSRANADVLPPI